MKALVLKELREIRGITLIALAAYLILLTRMLGLKGFEWVPAMPQEIEYPPFRSGQFLEVFIMLAGLFAIALGFRQSAWESSQGTYLYLLHRPLSRKSVFLTKLMTGMLVFVSCSAVPIVLYAWWAATPGHIASPFRWSWTAPAWCTIVLTLPIYLGAFLSGLRPAKWIGTRLLPLAAALLFFCFMGTMGALPIYLQMIAVVLAAVIFVCVIQYVARVRDYA